MDGQSDISSPPMGADVEYRVDDLARAAGTTVRNVRAYQDRGLLPPPRRVGRVAWYNEGHLARLALIGSLLGRGFTLANIGELIDGWSDGRSLGELVGFGHRMIGPYTDEVADVGTIADIVARYGLALDDADVVRDALDVGLVEIDGDQLRVPSPRLLRAGLELHEAGVPMTDLLAELHQVRAGVEAIAERFVALVVEHVVEPRLHGTLPSGPVAAELTETLSRLRPLATIVVTTELARALQARSTAAFGEQLARLVPDAHSPTPPAPVPPPG